MSVERSRVEDDQYGVLSPVIQQMGANAMRHPDQLIFGLLAGGFTTYCYDGQYFCDTDHPVGDGSEMQRQSVSNVQAGTGPSWFLMDCSQPIKPMIFQNRIAPRFTSLNLENDPNVFFNDEYVYGVRSRCNVGYGLWQLAFASNAPLNGDNYAAARAAMQGQVGDNGLPLGVNPTHLVVPPSLDRDARRLLVSSLVAQTIPNQPGDTGTPESVAVTNEWAGSAKLLMSQYLIPGVVTG